MIVTDKHPGMHIAKRFNSSYPLSLDLEGIIPVETFNGMSYYMHITINLRCILGKATVTRRTRKRKISDNAAGLIQGHIRS